MSKKLPKSFYLQEDVVDVSRQLLGKFLVTQFKGEPKTTGMIVETEAYKGPLDRGAHSYQNRKTPRTEIMFGEGGFSYVYICYGIHHLFNVVVSKPGVPEAILVRGVEPFEGVDKMMERRNMGSIEPRITAGPGSLSSALGIHKKHNQTNLVTSNQLWIEDRGYEIKEKDIVAGPRIGMNFDGPYKTIPWRFYIRGNIYVSKPSNENSK